MAKLEIELKFPAPDEAAAKAILAGWGALRLGVHTEQDHYFNAPDRDFAATNEAFRIRRIGEESRLTYKGPRQPGPAKIRKEIEVPLATGDAAFELAISLFQSLGYRSVAIVQKQREQWTITRNGFNLTICFDDVREVGKFMEVEIVADESMKSEAEKMLLEVCVALGLFDPEPRSYLRMLLAKRS